MKIAEEQIDRLLLLTQKNYSDIVALRQQVFGSEDEPEQDGFIQAGAAAISRSLQDKMRDVVSVKDFGAVGDGTIDDSESIQDANDYVESIGGTLVFPPGLYRTTEGIVIDASNVHWQGMAGARIKTDFAGDIITVSGSGGTKIKNVTVDGMRFVANTAHSSGAVFRLISCANVMLRTCDFGNGTTTYNRILTAGDATYADDCQRIHLDRCDFDSTGADNAIELVSGSIMTIDRCFFNGASAATTQAVILQNNGTRNWDGLDFTNCTCEQWPALLIVNGEGLSNFRIIGNISDRAETYSIFLVPDSSGTVKQGVIANNILYGDTTAGNPYGIYMQQTGGGTVADIVIGGNMMYDFDNRGIRIEDCDRIIVKGNILKNCGQSGTPAVTVTTSSSIVVSDNIIEDTAVSPAMTHGIEWGGVGTNRVKDNNIISGYATEAEIGSP